MFEQAFRNIDDVLRKEAGCTTELDYTEQTSCLLFLKYLHARKTTHAPPRQALPLGNLGRAENQGRPDRPQQVPRRRRPPRLRQPQALSLSARIQAEGH